ncbi:zinc finger-containing ubiquitin peptidase 1-like isoform X2 [Lutzomyia longipalpis]|uniref:zinc finger-containing ubiquitin peptidase 1-like isoform X2 n=1 Tax=Lutzomyia longipalpis TaxID=7200 RepID=UPI002483CC40|nr:zinc finger-containing ubiquitin peptidase 1-like isoform X2 [Lutzomyia longipalpis]
MADKEGARAVYAMQEHSCEICGMSGLSDDVMREHTRTCHVEGSAQCPFCGLSGVAAAELLLHVNQAHLDYLTPENELMSFIDDQSPSVDGDSDSMSECRGLSPSITADLPTNGICGGASTTAAAAGSNRWSNGVVGNHTTSGSNGARLGAHQNHVAHTNGTNNNRNVNNHSGGTSKGVRSKNCDSEDGACAAAVTKEAINGLTATNGGGQGSPLRSQLGLKLKTHTPATTKVSSPLQCPLCPYTSDNSTVLEEHINRSHFDPLSPSVNASAASGGGGSTTTETSTQMQCPICARSFQSVSDLELHVNIEHRDILSPGKIDPSTTSTTEGITNGHSEKLCPICNINLEHMKTQEMEVHIDSHFVKTPLAPSSESDLEKQAQKLREQREFEMLRAQYGMDDQGNFREQSAAAMQRAVYAGEMSVADYYERQVGLRAAESHGIDDGTSCTKSVAARVLSLSSSSPGVIKSLVCSAVDHYASSYGDKGWGCGYRNLQMLLSSLLQNTTYNEALYSAWGNQGPSRTAMPSISRLQVMVEAAWNQGFDVQGSESLGCKLQNTRKWIGATEVFTVLSWLRINCLIVDFHRPTSSDGRHPELFNWVLKYFEEPRVHTPPLYLQHQGHSRTIIGIEQRASGLTLLVLDPSHGPREVAALGSSQDSLRLIRRGPTAMRAQQYQIVAVMGLIETKEQYQASKVLRSIRIPPDR